MDKRVTEKINSLLKQHNKIIIAIEGSCASGKTTLSSELKEKYNCNIIHMDDFFLQPELRTPERMSEIGGNIDYERFKKEVADKIKLNTEFSYGKFDCSTGTISKKICVPPKKINIIEGVYCLHPAYDNIYNLKIFLKIDNETKIRRLSERNPEKVDRFIDEWIPKENNYFNTLKIMEKCDLIIDNNT